MAQIISITSEALQATIRRLLPSQQGFGEDLQATNVVTPIIDLTPTAEGSSIPRFIQQSFSASDITQFESNNNTVTIVTGGGFYRFFGCATIYSDATCFNRILLNDGSSDKLLWRQQIPSNAGSSLASVSETLDFTFFLRPTDSIKVNASTSNCFFNGSVRQVADAGGNLINPTGFTPQ